VVRQLRAEGYAIVSLEITTRSLDIRQFDGTAFPKLALIVGAENTGVSQELLDASDLTLHIPMFGQNSLMNLATACAIGVFELTGRFMPLAA
jgi:tRNA G18 (ribose-2'-O)-methylase SpoU